MNELFKKELGEVWRGRAHAEPLLLLRTVALVTFTLREAPRADISIVLGTPHASPSLLDPYCVHSLFIYYSFIVCACERVHGCIRASVHFWNMRGGQWLMRGISLPLSISTFTSVFETVSLTETGVHQFSKPRGFFYPHS